MKDKCVLQQVKHSYEFAKLPEILILPTTSIFSSSFSLFSFSFFLALAVMERTAVETCQKHDGVRDSTVGK